jgi:hypothetical protein
LVEWAYDQGTRFGDEITAEVWFYEAEEAGSISKRLPDIAALARAPLPAQGAVPTDEEIERAALKHVAPGFKQLVAVSDTDPDYRKGDQFKRLKAFVTELFAAPAQADDALNFVRSMIEDGYLSDTNTARGRAILDAYIAASLAGKDKK